jgi:hypothetical protein
MDFKCVVIIVLWTFLAGPVFGPPAGPHPTRAKTTGHKAGQKRSGLPQPKRARTTQSPAPPGTAR